MSLLALPPECLLLIIAFIAQDYDSNTLLQLLTVNKTLCAATLPFLYRDCYAPPWHRTRQGLHANPFLSQIRLTRLLLRQMPLERITVLLKVAYLDLEEHILDDYPPKTVSQQLGALPLSALQLLSQPKSSLSPSTPSLSLSSSSSPLLSSQELSTLSQPMSSLSSGPSSSQLTEPTASQSSQPTYLTLPTQPAQIHGATIRYGALIKHLHFHCEDNTCSILFQNKILRNHTKLRDHAKLSRLYLKYYAEDPRNRYMAEEREQIVFNGIALELQRDLTWALSYENPELLRTLAIPIKDLDRYLNRVHQFKSLTTVLFLIDKRLEYGDDITLDKADLLIYEPMKLLVYRLAAERQLKMRDMVRFVEKHVSTHEGVLQYVDCPPLMLLLGQQIQTCPPDVELKMLGLLPSLADTSLDLMIESRVK